MNRRTGITALNIFIVVLVVLAVVISVVAVLRLDVFGEKGSGLGKEFIFEIDTKIDPNLILYEESARPISTGLNASRAIDAGSDGRLYVAGDELIRVYAEGPDSNFSFFGEIKLPGAPQCLKAADDGKFYIGMKNHVEVYDGGGKRLTSWKDPCDTVVLTSIDVSKNDVFVADACNRVVLRYDTDGQLINRIGRKDKDRNISGFIVPSPYFDLAVARDGLLRVTNPGCHRIEAYTFDGDLEFSWGEFSPRVEGFCGCCNPVNFAILDDESFVTCEKGLTRVKIYDPDGNFVGVVAGPEQLLEGDAARVCEFPAQCQAGGFDVAVDARGRIFVLDTIKNLVRVYSRKRAEL